MILIYKQFVFIHMHHIRNISPYFSIVDEQAVVYLGTIEECPHFYDLDGHHRMHTGKVRCSLP
jgi:hypothetical protein